MEIFFPHDKFLDGKFTQHIPLFSTPASSQKIFLKTPVHFPITEKRNNEKKKKNKHASVICLLAKNIKFHIFVDRSLKLLQ